MYRVVLLSTPGAFKSGDTWQRLVGKVAGRLANRGDCAGGRDCGGEVGVVQFTFKGMDAA